MTAEQKEAAIKEALKKRQASHGTKDQKMTAAQFALLEKAERKNK